MRKTLTVRLDEETIAWLEAAAEETGRSVTDVVRDQLARGRAEGRAKSFMRLAGKASVDPRASERKGFSRK